MKRRDLLKTLPMGFGAALTLPLFAKKAHAIIESKMIKALTNPLNETDRIVVIVYLQGGNDGLNTIIPFQNPTYDKIRKNTGFTTAEEKKRLVHKISDTLAFNPYMEQLYPLWQEGKMGIVQNLGIMNPDLSHFRATDIWNSACDEDQLLATGWVGRWFNKEYPTYPDEKPQDPLAISIGGSTSGMFQGHSCVVDVLTNDPATYTPVGILPNQSTPDSLGGDELAFARELITINDFYGKRFNTLFPKYAQNKVQYPNTTFADQLKKIVWCIASGMKTRLYFTEQGSYDTHFNQHSKDLDIYAHAALLKDFAEAMNAFQADLKAFGLEDRVLTVTYSEFGRRAFENGSYSSGTDHGSCAPHFIFGSQINPGIYGHDPDIDHLDKNNDPFCEFEFRQMYASIMGDWFGVSKETCTEVLSPGRDRDPFETTFPLNGTSIRQPLVKRPSDLSVRRKENTSFKLLGNSPNPVRDHTTIRFQLAESSNVRLEVFDTKGSMVRTLVNNPLSRGSYEIPFETKGLPTGTYLYRLTSNNNFVTSKMTVVK